MSEEKKLTRAQQIERFVKANAVTKDKGITGHARDTGLSLLSGAVSVPETAVGIADLVTGGQAGKALENEGGMFGFRPKEAKEAIAGWKTERAQKQLQDFQEADGIGAKFGEALSNPSLVANTVAESLPAMGAGGVVGRGIGAVAPRLAGVAGGAIGEGTVGAGLAAEQIRQQTDDGLLTDKQAALAGATGVATAGFGYAGGRIAKKLGLGDVDTALAGGGLGGSNKNIVRRTLEGALTEGLLEELPQSVSEQVLQNEALGKPLDEGVDEAAVLGLLSGGLMGGAAGLASRNTSANDQGDSAPGTDLALSGNPQPSGSPNRGGGQGQLDNLNPNFFNRGQGPDAGGMRTLNPDPQLGFRGRDNRFNSGPNGEVFTDAQYNDYLAQQQAQARAARDAGVPDINDITQTPQGYDRFGSDPQLLAPNDFTGSADGTLQTAADIATGVNTAARREQQAREEARASRARGEVVDRTNVPSEPGGFGFFGNRPNEQTPAEKMGVDESRGSMSKAAALAVNTGASPQAENITTVEGTANEQDAPDNIQAISPRMDANRVNSPAGARATESAGATESDSGSQQATQAARINDMPGNASTANTQEAAINNERLINNTAVATGKDGKPKWFGREQKAQDFIAKKNIADTHEVVAAGKSRFEIQPKAPSADNTGSNKPVVRTTPVKDEAKATGKTYTADNDEIPYQWDVVDAKDLVSSHSNTFGKNPDFPEGAQPRDRANSGYQAQVLDIQNKLRPEWLGESAIASDGSPIIGSSDNVVESGNGRTIAIRRAYNSNDEKAEQYRQFVKDSAEKFGLDADAVSGMNQPVLVRRNLSGMDRSEFAIKANDDNKAAMSSTELARIDAKAIPSTDLIEFDSNGSMNLNASRRFVQQFTKALGTNEASNLTDKDGNLSQTGKLRVTGALLHNAYGSDKLTRAVTETLDPSSKNVLKTLTDKAPQINKLKQDISEGNSEPTTLGEDIATAAEKYIDLANNGTDIDLFLANNDLFSEDAVSPEVAEIISDFNNNSRSAVKIGAAIQARIDAANNAGKTDLLSDIESAPPVNNKKRSVLRSKNKPEPASETVKGRGFKVGDKIMQNNGVTHVITGVKNNDSGGMDSLTTKAIDGGHGNYKITNNERSWTTSEYFRHFGENAKANIPADTVTPQDDVVKSETAQESAIEDTKTTKDTPAAKDKFADNKLFTSDAVAKARARMKSKLGNVNSGLDPELLVDGVTIAGAYVESGVRKFGDYAKAMIADFGKDITPYLSTFWEGVRRYPGLDTEGMTSTADSDAQFKQLMLEYKPSKDMEAVLGEDKTQAKPKRKVTKPTNKQVMLRQDWGVDRLDGYAESDEFTGEQTDYGVSGGVKDAFLKDAKRYLTATKKQLESLGYEMALDRKNKPMKVSVNESGPATAGEVSLSMYKGGSHIHVSIGQSSVPMLSMFRDVNADGTPVNNAPHPQQVAVMYRTSMNDGDTYATKHNNSSGNIWVSHKLTATELAQDIDKTSNAVAARANKGAKSNESTTGTTQQAANPKASRTDQKGAQEVREPRRDAQSGVAQDDTGVVEAGQPQDDSTPTETESTRRSGIRGSGTDVASEGSVPSQRNAADRREGASPARASDAGTRERTTTSSGTTSPAATQASATDLIIENPLEIVGGTPVQRFNKNREALELFQKLEVEARQATPEEQRILAGYIGWGSFGQELFQGSWDHPKYRDEGIWKERGEWLRETLGESAWKSAQRSITNAHYTDPPTVMAMWSMVERMGFEGGRVLEPSMGTGNFFSMMPPALQSRSQLTGIELDEMTGAIAKQLFPQSNIRVMGYQDSKTPDNFYDVVIGNYPFENTPVADRRYNKLNPMLHDYFFLKSMDQVRPGGIVISITSSGTMDKQNTGIRRELAKQAELVAAIRLPSGAFKDYAGTDVVTDIIILKKREEKLAMVPEDATWVNVADYTTPSGEDIKLSQYYIDNPQNIIGTIDFGSGTTKFGAGMIVKRPDNMEQRLKDAINLVPENIIQDADTTDHLTYYANETGERHGALFVNDNGELMLARGDQTVMAQDIVKYAVKSKATTADREKQIKSAINLRRLHSSLVDKERSGQEAETERKALKKAYNSFVKDHGSLRDSYALKYMDRSSDQFYLELAALENDDGTPATILSKSTTRGMVTMDNPSVRDAYVLARNKSVSPTLKEIAALTNKSENEIRKELKDTGAVFEAPNGDIVPSDIYLSGNVRQKLREAQAALKDGNKAMKENVAALEQVVPTDVPYFNIETKLGATWIPSETYQDYIAYMLGRDSREGIDVRFLSGRWKVRLEKGMNNTAEARNNYGTEVYPFSGLVQAAFSNQVVRITRKVDGEEIYDSNASAEANGRIAKMRDEFSEWMWGDPERRFDLEKEYNEARNAWATPKYDGSFLTFEGMALTLGKGEFNLREHQANAIWRGIVNRRSINAHEVGTGKTFTMAGIAIESRRYGIAKKPVLFAHNANSAAVAEEIRMMYPAARVLYINNLQPKERDLKLRQIANDDWDVVVLPHSLIDRLALTEDTLMAMAADDIAALEQEFREAAEEDGIDISKVDLDDDKSISNVRSVTAKELAKTRKRVIETIKKQAQKATKDSAVSFEQLGIDMILVDEVHEFKKPPIVTRMQMKGLNTQVSQRSIQLQFLTRYIRQMNNGGNVHTFTGTPITNTITEIYHQMRYVMDTEMQEASVSDWDGWFGSFATEVQDVELSSAGDYEMVTRLAGFVNVPELRQMIGQYMDTVFAEDMPEMQPRKSKSGKTMTDDNLTEAEKAELLNGRTEGAKDRPYKKVINETADMTSAQKSIFAKVQGYAKEWRDAAAKQRRKWQLNGDHRTPLAYGRLADTASFDARLLDPSLVGMEGKAEDDPNSKTSRVVKNVKDIYDSHDLANQVIFMDKGYGTKAKRSGGRNADGEKNPDITVDIFSPVLDLVERLVQSGIPREQIAVVSGNTSKDKRSEIAAGMNDGSIRVVIGSTQTLGVGVNMQRNLRAMHHMDAPYMPGELEQRNGRGQRQGNQWNTVLEYRYMTDRLDGKRWQILAVKQRFITAFMKSNGKTRTIEGDAVEEQSDILESFSEAAGDPRILQRVKLQKKLEQLNSKERLHTRGIADMRRTIRSQTEAAANNQAELDKIKPDVVAKALEDQRENFSLTLGDKTYNKRADANAALKDYIRDNVRLGDKSTRIGSYGDVPLYVAFKPMSTDAELVVTIGGRTFSGKGLTGLESVMRNLPKVIEKLQTAIEKSKASINNLKKVVNQPFAQKEELARVKKQIEDLEADLDNNPVPPPTWLRQGAPMDSEVFYDKKPFVVTGHRYSKDGYFVMAEDDKGTVVIPYLEAKDASGMELYEEVEFVEPEVIETQEDKLGEDDRVPDSDAPMTLEEAQRQATKLMGISLDDEGMPISDDQDVRDEYFDRVEELLAVGDVNGEYEPIQTPRQPSEVVTTSVDDMPPGKAKTKAAEPNRTKKAPNGKPSNLNDKQWAEVRTPAFKEWFGDWENDPANASKVVDENGEPLVVYHGTQAEFYEFDIERLSENTDNEGFYGSGFYFSSKEGASDYGEKLISSYLNIKNPLRNTQEDLNQFKEDMGHPIDEDISIPEDITDEGFEGAEFTEELKRRGYDGVLADQDMLGGNPEFVVFSSNQIKSADANTGDFSRNNNDIRYSRSKLAKGSTKTTRQQVINKLYDKFGKSVIDGLIADGTLDIKVLNDYVADGKLTIPDDVGGIYSGGRATLIADNLTDDMIIPTFIHELGGHGGLQTLMTKKSYDALMRDFDSLVKAGDPMALKAKAQADAVSNNQEEANDEYLAYLITYASEQKEARGGKVSSLINRIAMAIRSWLKNTLGVPISLNSQEILALAEHLITVRANLSLPVSANNTSSANDGMKFSRAAGMNDQFDPRTMAKESVNRFHDWASSKPPGKLSWWHKTVGTMYNLAQRSPYFKPVFDNTEKFINDVSYYAAKASELAPKLLPQLDSLKDIAKSAIGAKDNDAISKPIFEGTLLWGRDLNGKAVLIEDWRKKVMAASKQDRLQMLRDAGRITPAQEAELATLNATQADRFINGIIDEEVNAGLVWTDSELRSKFNLNDDQIALYREFRAATDNSLDSLTRSDMLRKLGKNAADIETEVMQASSLRRAVHIIEEHINKLSTDEPKKAKAFAKNLADIKLSAARTNKLIADGYAPLSRFGQYTVDVVDSDGNREYFGMFESAYDARKMKAEMDALYSSDDGFSVTQGALSKEEFKMFSGVTPETAELFGEMLGLDATGDKAADDAFQEFLRRTKNNRSAMKRLMHRKGIKGYSEDVGRVLASFIYSNARHTSAGLNMGNIDRSIEDIPKGEGQLKDAAVKLAQYIKNPQEEGSVIRGWMFAQYLGGSIASAVVNLTQPIAVSFPYLSQFGGAKKSAAELSRAANDWAKKKTFAPDLQKAIKDAEADGTLSPQEVHNLLRQARGDNPLRAGDGTKYGDSKAALQNGASRLSLMWGSLFSLAEQINRRVTFVAAYRMAQDQGIADPAAFARKSIKETQFVYNKASRMQWGRGAIGGTLMTFKTYSVSYIELMHRLWTQGEKGSPERQAGRKAAWLMMGTLFLLGGGGGLPFMEDAEDLIDGAGQIMGYNFSSRKKREEVLDAVFGEMLGDFLESGISGIPGAPTDVSARLGMDDLIPGTGVFKQRTNNTRDVLELGGPAGDFIARVGSGSRSILKGAVSGDVNQIGRGALELSPVAVKNAIKGSNMLATGTYKDTRGYKVDDVTPIDAAFKAIGFQPKDISKIQSAAWLSQSNTAYYNLRASEIRALWASGIVDGNKSKVDDARAALKEWNRKNPDQKIVIRPTDIQRRIREMKMNKSDRITKLAPKSMRGQIQDDFAAARGEY